MSHYGHHSVHPKANPYIRKVLTIIGRNELFKQQEPKKPMRCGVLRAASVAKTRRRQCCCWCLSEAMTVFARSPGKSECLQTASPTWANYGAWNLKLEFGEWRNAQ